MRRTGFALGALLFALAPATARGDGGGAADFTGSWYTTFGMLELKQGKDGVTGSYGQAGTNTMTGKVEGRVLKATYREGDVEGGGTYEMNAAGNAFKGTFKIPSMGREGEWSGWRQDPKAEAGPPQSFAGLWLTPRGWCELVQNGAKVTGAYASYGPVK